HIKRNGQGVSRKEAFTELDARARSHEADGGARLRFLCPPTSSPLLAALKARVLARLPNAKFVAWSAVDDDHAHLAGPDIDPNLPRCTAGRCSSTPACATWSRRSTHPPAEPPR